jgi:hypothetical protein
MAKEPKETAAAEEAAAPKNIKILLRRDARVNGKICKAGTTHMVDAEQAEMLCKEMPGYYPFYGHMPEVGPLLGGLPNPLAVNKFSRATRVA